MEGEGRRVAGSGGGGLWDETLACVFKYVESERDRAAVSLVCQQWRRVDGMTRRFVTVAYMYSASPELLVRRFRRLEGVMIKGKPRAAEYDLLVPGWGGYADPWLRELGRAYPGLQTLQLRRCQVSDADLALVAASAFSPGLQVLHLHKCAGFSTAGLVSVARFCRSLNTLSLEESDVADEGGEWLHELATNNTVLEVLNFAVLGLEDVDVADLALLVERCKSLVSLRVGEIEMVDIIGALNRASSLKDLGAGSCSNLGDEDSRTYVPNMSLPTTLRALSGLWGLNDAGLGMVLPVAPNLKKLDLKFTLLSSKACCELFSQCHVLEELQVRNAVGDEAMEVLGRTCRSLRRLRVDHDEGGAITQRGVVAVAQGCPLLRQAVLYVSDITNAALAMVGQGCPEMTDFRLVLEPAARHVVDLPLDDGLKLLLKGCLKLSKLAIYVRHGGLTDRGMGYIGEFGTKLKWLLLGCTGESDIGLANMAYKAHSIQRLEIRDCPFGEAGLVAAVVAMDSLKFLWVQGSRTREAGSHLLALRRPHLNIELNHPTAGQPGQLIAHYSLVGPRTDSPPEVKLLVPNLDDPDVYASQSSGY